MTGMIRKSLNGVHYCPECDALGMWVSALRIW